MSRASIIIVLACVPWVTPGCKSDDNVKAFTETLFNPFNLNPLFDVKQEPVRVGIVSEHATAWDVRAWWDITDRTPWIDFRRELGRQLGRPIQVSHLKLFQVEAQLASGRLDFAILTEEQRQDVEVELQECFTIAVARRSAESGLIVASAKSDVQSIADIAGKRFAFGPRGDAVLHYGAAAALMEHDVTPDKIKREIIPINTLQYHLTPMDAAKEIVYGATPAGVISKADYERFPDTGGTLLPLNLSKDQFRVLGETPSVNYGPVIASPKADPETTEKVREFLLAAADRYPKVTRSMMVAGFTGVDSPSP